MAKALVIASFGTTYTAERAWGDLLVTMAEERWPGWRVVQAYTSRQILARLDEMGEPAPGALEAVLEQLDREGYDEIRICPTHLIAGKEYRDLCRRADAITGRFARLTVGRPLLESDCDRRRLMQILLGQHSAQEGHAYILAGHGVEGETHPLCAQLTRTARELGRSDLCAAVLIGRPGLEEVLQSFRGDGISRITLIPLFLTAGKHVRVDLAGEGGASWLSRLEAAGYSVSCHLQGLLEIHEVRVLFQEHWMHTAC